MCKFEMSCWVSVYRVVNPKLYREGKLYTCSSINIHISCLLFSAFLIVHSNQMYSLYIFVVSGSRRHLVLF
jgi:hypothetical protein